MPAVSVAHLLLAPAVVWADWDAGCVAPLLRAWLNVSRYRSPIIVTAPLGPLHKLEQQIQISCARAGPSLIIAIVPAAVGASTE
jgi:hypothetical protein